MDKIIKQYLALLFFALSLPAKASLGQTSAIIGKKNKNIKEVMAPLSAVKTKKTGQKRISKKTFISTLAKNNKQKEKLLEDMQKTKEQNIKTQKDNHSPYSFRPLLIQGQKRLIQKTKEMKMESGNIVESELFFVDIDFHKRIFE